MLNKSLTKAIEDVISQSTYGLYNIEFKLLSTDGKFVYKPIHVDSLTIYQDFLGGYGDQIEITFPIAFKDYALLYDYYQKLTAQLVIKFLTKDGIPVKGAPLLVKKYIPVFSNQRDPSKSTNDVQSRTTIDTHLKVTLVEPTLYYIRKLPIQGIFHNTTLEGAMAHIAEGYQIPNILIQTPDNTHVYDHIVINPYSEFKDIFHLLQETYGVYMCGLNNYFTDDTLYVYAPLDTIPQSSSIARILHADTGAYAGSPSFHRAFDRGVSIVINNEPKADDHSVISSEHQGTSLQFLRASPQVDNIVSQDDNGLRTFNSDSVISVRLNSSRLAKESTNKTIYAHQSDNMFALASELSRHQFITIDALWPQARPWLLKPNQAVEYYSDEHGKVGKRTGQIQSVYYELVRGDRAGVNTYTCIASIKCRLSPNEQLSDTIDGVNQYQNKYIDGNRNKSSAADKLLAKLL